MDKNNRFVEQNSESVESSHSWNQSWLIDFNGFSNLQGLFSANIL